MNARASLRFLVRLVSLAVLVSLLPAASRIQDPASDRIVLATTAQTAPQAANRTPEGQKAGPEGAIKKPEDKSGSSSTEEQNPRLESLLKNLEDKSFRGFVSLLFVSGPITALLLVLLLSLHFSKDSASRLAPFFGGDRLAQLIVIVIIAGNVCSLAIMGVMGTSEVAAIYGGIIGYVLGSRGNTVLPPAGGNGGAGGGPKVS